MAYCLCFECSVILESRYCMSTVQFCWHFWPFNFTYGCIVCLEGPWIRAPFFESCWDKNPGTANPFPSSERRWQTKGHQDENTFHCTFKACTAESDCSKQWLCNFPTSIFVLGGMQRPECWSYSILWLWCVKDFRLKGMCYDAEQAEQAKVDEMSLLSGCCLLGR